MSFETKKRAETFHEDDDGNPQFLPYVRDEETLARVWAKPGTPGHEHRIGGLEKDDPTGDVSYDAGNHQKMTQMRAEKVMRVRQDIPPTQIYGDQDADLLVFGWGSTKGAIEEAVERAVEDGVPVARAHLRHVWPLPGDLGEILERYDRVLVPELNNGQLSRLLRDEYLKDVRPLNKIQGRPFRAEEILDEIKRMTGQATPA